MSTAVTKQDLKKLGEEFREEQRKNTNEILEVLQAFMHQVDERFNKVEARQNEQDAKFDVAGRRCRLFLPN